MVRHFIILSSSYSLGKRICLHFPDYSDAEVQSAVDAVGSAYDGKRVSFSTHSIHTVSKEWKSVCETDPYFEDVMPIETVDEFISLICKERIFSGLEVARYILSKVCCTHTRLEKLVYYCYADYYCATGRRLFEDTIYAFEHGPVIGSVYRAFSEYSRVYPGNIISEGDIDHRESVMPIRSRLLFAEDGQMKVDSIDHTLSMFAHIDTETLVEMTHREGSPWYRVDRSHNYAELSDELIGKYHCVELTP